MESVRFISGEYRVINYHMNSLYMVQGYLKMKDKWFNIVAYDNLNLAIAKAKAMILNDAKIEEYKNKDIIKRKISKYTCTIDFNKGTVSIVDDWMSNYGVIYIHLIGKYNPIQGTGYRLIGMDSCIPNKKITAFFEYHIKKHYSK